MSDVHRDVRQEASEAVAGAARMLVAVCESSGLLQRLTLVEFSAFRALKDALAAGGYAELPPLVNYRARHAVDVDGRAGETPQAAINTKK